MILFLLINTIMDCVARLESRDDEEDSTENYRGEKQQHQQLSSWRRSAFRHGTEKCAATWPGQARPGSRTLISDLQRMGQRLPQHGHMLHWFIIRSPQASSMAWMEMLQQQTENKFCKGSLSLSVFPLLRTHSLSLSVCLSLPAHTNFN